jgi:SAM-dependent methyltransferase
VVPALRPSEYTSALIHALRIEAAGIRGARVLEIGCVSGVVLAALGAMGAASLCGVDIEQDAIAASARLLHECGYGANVELHRGDMWRPVAGRRFDLIVANLPHFPMEPVEFAGRLPTWSAGGADGRHLLDPFLVGLAKHLAPGGRAVITHNVRRPRAVAQAVMKRLRSGSLHTLVYISPEKIARMPRRFCVPRMADHHRYGPIPSANCTSLKSPPEPQADMMVWRALLFAIAAAFAALPAAAETPDAALAKLIEDARAEAAAPTACTAANLDRLVRIFCENRIRPGVREYYPLFGTRQGEVRSGYDVDVARALAKRLGVEPVFVRVNAASRVPLLAEDRIDVILATMGHNTQRDGRFALSARTTTSPRRSWSGPRRSP